MYNATKRVYESSHEKYSTKQFLRDRLIEIARAQEELHNRKWCIEQMHPFLINERGHPRKIIGNTPHDRMILHSYLDNSLGQELKPFLLYDNYASQEDKGVDLARDRFKMFLQRMYNKNKTNKFYILLLDFRKFYDNVQHQKLYDEIMRVIPYDEFHEYMIWTILDSFKQDVSWMTDEEYANCMNVPYIALDHLYEKQKGTKFMAKSINIGNPASQLFSIFYPTRIDNYCKIVRGTKEYGRYMDDIFAMNSDKNFLKSLLDGIYKICDELALFINPKKTYIIRADNEFKYLNRMYTLSEHGFISERLVSETVRREKRKLEKLSNLGKSVDEHYNTWIGSFGKCMNVEQVTNLREYADKIIMAGKSTETNQ